jgi:GAF domain-containing protein
VVEHRGEERSSDDELELVARIARQLSEAGDLDHLLQLIVDLGEHYIEGCDGVSLMLIRARGSISSPAYSSVVAYESDLAQYATDEGPCLEAIREHETVLMDDLETETRWPAYREAALALGVRSMISFRLFVLEDTMGALDFYSGAPHTFARRAQLLGEVFASHAAVALKSAISETGLRAALDTRDVIGQAKGVLMERERLGPDEAFARLQRLSQDHHRPLREIAEDLARTGHVPD